MRTIFQSTFVGIMLLSLPAVVFGQAPSLGAASSFAMFTAAGAFSNDGLTFVTGDIGTNVGAFAGFPPGIVNGNIHVADPVTAQAAADVELAYGGFGPITCDVVLGTTLGNNQVLAPAVFCLGAASTLNGDLILDGGCDPNALFIFKIDGALSTTSFSNIILTNSASLCNVYWQINGAVSLGVNSNFQGTIVASGAISVLSGASLHGRGLTREGAIDMHNNNVDIDMQPTASMLIADGPVVFCEGDSVVLSGNCGGVWSNGATTPTITVTTSGTYSITNSNGCGSATSNVIIVTVNPPPTCLIMGDDPICEGQTTELCVAAGLSSYLWSTGATTNCITVGAAGIYSVTIVDGDGCSSTCSRIIDVNPMPSCTITGATTICEGQTTELCTPAGAGSYLWNTGEITNCITVGAAGTYSVVVTGANGCTSECSITVVDGPGLICTITGATTICEGQTTDLCATAGAAGYLWNTGEITNCITVGAAGTYSVVVTGANGCTSECSITVVNGPGPSCTITGATAICEGQTTDLCATAGAAGYLWNTGATTNCITVGAAGTYSVVVTGANGCTSECSITVVNGPGPSCTITGTTTICEGQTTELCTPAGAAGYLWSTGATTNCITVGEAGTYSVVVTGANGCTSECSITVSNVLGPNCTITGATVICEGQTTQLCTPAGAAGYLWNTGATSNCITVSVAGTYSVVVTGANGCTSACSVTVANGPGPNCTITGENTICEGQTTDLCVPDGALTYSWNTGAITNCITVSAAGTYSVTIVYESGCVSICSIPVSVNPSPTCNITGGNIPCVGQTTQLCTAAGAAGYLWNTGATTNCITVGAAGTYSVVVTGANGCTSACSILVVIDQDNTPPSITCPSDLTIECDASSLPPDTGTATATDNCDQAPLIPTFTDLILEGICPQSSTITRTWTATNASGNSISCTQTITIIDSVLPTIFCPANLTVDCNASTLPPGTGTPNAADNCDTAPIFDFTDATTSGSCAQEATIIRTWVATDACGNSSSCNQTITTSDNAPPVISCPPNLTVSCDGGVLPANTGTATASDNCNPAPVVTFNDVTTPGTCPQSFTIARTWTASDGCGNSSSCNQLLTVGDLVSPAIVCPANVVVQCAEQVPVANPALVIATDNCSGPVTVSYLGENIANQTCENQYVLTRLYRALDACGNAATCAQTITVFDNTPPAIAFINPLLVLGGTINVQCFGQDPAWNLPTFDEGSIVASDVCAGGITVAFNEVLEQAGDCAVDGFINRYRLTWTATDICGNSSSAFVFLALIDTIAPTIVGVPNDISINCDEIPAPPVNIVGEDECLCACILSFGETLTLPGCQDGQIIVRSWTAKDQCGNQTTATQEIALIDNAGPNWFVTVPEIMGITGDTILEYPCSGGFPAYLDFLNEEVALGPNSCGGSTVLAFDVKTNYADNCELAGYVEQRTYHWTAVDACGNTSSLTILARLTDHEPPVITGILPMACFGDTLNLVTATDNCGVPFMGFQDALVSNPCGNGKAVQRTYEAKDGCGNIATSTGILLPNDNLAPKIWFTNPVLEELEAGEALTMDCAASNGQYTSFGINDVDVADGCTVGLSVNFSETLITAGDCATNGSVAVIQLRWTATDICGNLSELVVRANIVDESSPVFLNFPAELTIACNAALPEYSVTDNCGEVTTTTWDTIIPSDCMYEYDLQRIITATDLCGNTTTQSQTIHVGDGGGPAISGVVPVVCDDVTVPVVKAYDACADAFVEVFMEEDTVQALCGGLVIERTWSATGICGNETIVHQSIILNDTTPPVIIIPDFSFILHYYGNTNNLVFLSETALIDQLNALNNGSVNVLNGCGEAVLTVTTTYAADCYILGYFEQRRYTWTAIDACGNTSSISFVVNIMDDIPPVFVEVSHESFIVCVELPPAPIVVTESEPQPVKIVYTELIEPGGALGEYKVTRTWVATDACGNTSVYTQVIKWIPDTFLDCSITVPDPMYCNTHGVVISGLHTGGNGAVNYDWEIVGKNCFIQGGQGTPEINIYMGWTDAKIILTVTDEYGCVSICTTTLDCQFSLEKSLGELGTIVVNDAKQNDLRQIDLWPNPANRSVNLGFESSVDDLVELSISNSLGKVVFADKINAKMGLNTRTIDMSQVREGSYWVQVKTNKEVHTKVVVIMRSN